MIPGRQSLMARGTFWCPLETLQAAIVTVTVRALVDLLYTLKSTSKLLQALFLTAWYDSYADCCAAEFAMSAFPKFLINLRFRDFWWSFSFQYFKFKKLFQIFSHVQLYLPDVQTILNNISSEQDCAEARTKVEESLRGKIITTMHGVQASYQFAMFSDLTALSPFPEDEKRKKDGGAQPATFVEYFREKYGIELKHPDSPLIQARLSISTQKHFECV
jgi:hypothetical protein